MTSQGTGGTGGFPDIELGGGRWKEEKRGWVKKGRARTARQGRKRAESY